MTQWARRIRGALGMGLIWAVVWGIVGVLLGLVVDPDGSLDEMWVMVGGLPGLLGGVVFSAVLGMAARRRRLDELSLPGVARWGTAAGLLVGVLPFLIGDAGSASPRWLPAVVVGTITLLGALSAAGSLALARTAERRSRPRAGVDPRDVGLAAGTPHPVPRVSAPGS